MAALVVPTRHDNLLCFSRRARYGVSGGQDLVYLSRFIVLRVGFTSDRSFPAPWLTLTILLGQIAWTTG
jgi:hypothetical protein